MTGTDVTDDSIFTRIIKGEIPCHKIYEDERTFAFLDIHPIQPGHVLVVPKRQIAYAWDLEDDDYQAVMAAAKRIALALRASFPDKRLVAMQIEGTEVAHTHVKLFPFNTGAEFHRVPDASQDPDHTALAEVAKTVVASLGKL